MDSAKYASNRLDGTGVVEVEVPLQMQGASGRGDLVAIEYVTWEQRIELILVIVWVVGPGEDDRSGTLH